MWNAELEARSAEMRAEQSRARVEAKAEARTPKKFCVSCGRGMVFDQEAKCFRCRKNGNAEFSTDGLIVKVPVALNVKRCIACRIPFEPVAPSVSYCSRVCAARGRQFRKIDPQDWDACRMLADLDYTGPYPFAGSCWAWMMQVAWDSRSGCRFAIRY